MKLDSKALLKVAQGDIKATLNGDLLLDLAKERDIESKTELAKEINLSRMHLYRLLDGTNAGITAIKKISDSFSESDEDLFFLEFSNKNDPEQLV